jgi:molybdopterin/thiamine biosynthesis adenylyltransferase
MNMLEQVFKIKDTIDVFVSQTEHPDKLLLTFHRMTTRERLELVSGKAVAEFLALLNGKDNVIDILQKLGDFDNESALKLLDFLTKNHLVVKVNQTQNINPRFDRQIAYLDDMVMDRSGDETQRILESKKVVILGCGATGSAIAETLVRFGVFHLVLVDYKNVSLQSINRHLFTRQADIGKSKVQALAEFLRKIDSKAEITIYQQMLLPNTDLSQWITDDVDLVINSCDEPYIGHTSLKIGRYVQTKNIALYVAGGFDAHLMSSGELIFPPRTPCIDCAQQTFTQALGEWKPTYSAVEKQSNATLNTSIPSNYLAGGAGGLAIMSGFSAQLAALNILQFLMEDSAFDYKIKRYEYLPNNGNMTAFEMQKQGICNVCNN